MATLREMISQARADGYQDDNAEAKVCQDIVLKALSESSLCRNATIKGGVVMRSITGDSRRATQDMDIDFIRYSISDDSIQSFIQALDCLPNIHIAQTGRITELRQQDYHGNGFLSGYQTIQETVSKAKSIWEFTSICELSRRNKSCSNQPS